MPKKFAMCRWAILLESSSFSLRCALIHLSCLVLLSILANVPISLPSFKKVKSVTAVDESEAAQEAEQKEFEKKNREAVSLSAYAVAAYFGERVGSLVLVI